MRCLAVSGIVALMALQAGASLAHTVGVSKGDYRVSGTTVKVELVFARPELTAAFPGLDANGDGSVVASEAEGARPILEREIAGRIDLRTDGGSCPGALENALLTEEDGLALRLVYRCRTTAESQSIRLGFLRSLSLDHRHLASVTGPDGETVHTVAYEARPDIQFSRRSAKSGTGVAWSLFRLGIDHILSGYDHLVFLFGLILVGGRLRKLLVVVSAFTLAHSISLALVALGAWTPPPSIVEPAIALSIVYVGIENWFLRDAGRRWLVTFPFGLVHGFGFAGALAEISLPSSQIPLALASFNVGVEAGQVAVLVVALPAVLWLGRRPWFADVGMKAASAAIALAGFIWFGVRLA